MSLTRLQLELSLLRRIADGYAAEHSTYDDDMIALLADLDIDFLRETLQRALIQNLTIGSRIVSREGEQDEGIMSTDPTDTVIERRTGPNAMGTVTRIDQHGTTAIVHVEFLPSEVWVCLEPDELADPSKYTLL